MTLRGVLAIVLCGSLSACGAAPTVIPARNLERPGDMGFVCLAIDSDGTLSGRPMSVCHPPDGRDPVFQASAKSPRLFGTFAFVTNTARGEMAAVDLDIGRLIDLDPGVFGFNMVPVGSMPETLAASPDGCLVVTANRNSCDFGLVDPSRLLASLFGSAAPHTGPGNPVSRVAPKTNSGRLLNASPKEIVFLLPPPGTVPGLCQAWQSPPDVVPSWPAVVTFPSCDLVALLDMPSGTIKDSVFIHSGGVIPAGNEPSCPADCDPSSAPDAGTTPDDGEEPAAPADDGGADQGEADAGTPSRLGVGALVLRPDSPRVYVGASAADDFLTALDIVADIDTGEGRFVIPAGGGRIALERGAIGIDHLRLSVNPFKSTPITLADGSVVYSSGGSFLEGRGYFLYAFARDGSVRVVNVGVQPEQECDVNVRPDRAKPANTGCFPVNPKARQPLAQGPGIRIPTLPVLTAAPPIPRDIAVVDLPVGAAAISKDPESLSGQFAFLLASNDAVYILNLAPTTLSNGQVVNEDNTLTHSFREIRSIGQYTADTLALSSTPPLRTAVASDLLFPTTPILSSVSGPRLEEVVNDPIAPASGNSINATTNYWANFPYQATYVSRVLSIAWEAPLPGSARSSGVLHYPAANSPAGALDDVGADFCAKGVLAGDLVVLPGCNADTDCTPQDSFSCRQPIGGATGLCLPKGATQQLVDGCTRVMGSRRRYEIITATPTELALGLHLDEVPKTVLNREAGDDSECQPTSAHKGSDKLPGFQWQQVWPGENFKRCVKACGYLTPTGEARPDAGTAQDADQDCRPGFVCETILGSLGPRLPRDTEARPGPGRYCVEAPPLDLACWPQPGNRYHVNAGTSFLVAGSALPNLGTTTAINGQCQLDPNRDPALADRIPLSAPVCATIDGVVPIDNVTRYSTGSVYNTEVALFGQATPPIPDPSSPANPGTPATPNPPYSPVTPPGPNPCLYQDFSYDDPTSVASASSAGSADGGVAKKPVKAIFQNPQMRFVLTNLDQYGGDSLATQLNLIGGFIPETVPVPSYDVALTQPIRLFTGPTKTPESPLVTDPTSQVSYPYVYVLDQGRTALTPSSRGQIVRINARKGDNAVTTLDPASSGTTPFQIQ
jgi:hypothetical protein